MSDLRFAIRQLVKHPSFTAVAVIALSLGIGVNTTIFSFTERILWRPINLRDADRIVAIWIRDEGVVLGRHDRLPVPPADFHDWQRQLTVFESLSAYVQWAADFSDEGEPERLVGCRVTPEFFATLGVSPALGAGLSDSPSVRAGDEIVLSHRLWQRRYQENAEIVGQTIRINGVLHRVAGVMPAEFDFPTGALFWTPLALTHSEWTQRSYGPASGLDVLGRLHRSVSFDEAAAELRTVSQRLAQSYPETNARRGVNPLMLQKRAVIESGSTVPLILATGSTVFVFLLVCANLANAQLARSLTRSRELAIRSALGATRGRIVWQLVLESLLPALIGGVAGMVFAVWGIQLMKAAMPADVAQFISGWREVRVEWRVLGFAVALSVVSGLVSGVTPAMLLTRSSLFRNLKEGGPQSSAAPGGQWLRKALVVFQVALALVLLTGSGLLLKAFLGMVSSSSNADLARVLSFEVDLPGDRYGDAGQRQSFFDRSVAELNGIPGVRTVALASRSPVDNWFPWMIEFEDAPLAPRGNPKRIPAQSVSAGFFDILQVTLRAGRMFNDRDDRHAPPVALLSESAAKRFFGDESPVGHLFLTAPTNGRPSTRVTVVGVVADLRAGAQQVAEAMYLPSAQQLGTRATFLVETTLDGHQVMGLTRERMRALDPDLPLIGIMTLADAMWNNLGGLRVMAGLLTVTGIFALGLAVLGIYSVMNQTVARRTQEIGVRLALGARRANILALVVWMGGRLAFLGLLLGLPLALGLGWILASQLGSELAIGTVEVGPLAAVMFILGIAAAFSCYLPARRATRIDPMEALRTE